MIFYTVLYLVSPVNYSTVATTPSIVLAAQQLEACCEEKEMCLACCIPLKWKELMPLGVQKKRMGSCQRVLMSIHLLP